VRRRLGFFSFVLFAFSEWGAVNPCRALFFTPFLYFDFPLVEIISFG